MDLTPEEIKMLAQQEKQMDRGEVPYVMSNGRRWATTQEVMEFFELEQGENVSDLMIIGILKKNIEICQRKMAEIDDTVLGAETIES